jgi:hypothetical protein
VVIAPARAPSGSFEKVCHAVIPRARGAELRSTGSVVTKGCASARIENEGCSPSDLIPNKESI